MRVVKIIMLVLVGLVIIACAGLFIVHGDYVSIGCENVAAFADEHGMEKLSLFLYKYAVKRDPENNEAAYSLALMYFRQGNYTKAEYLLYNAIQDSPDNAEPYLTLCRVYTEQDKLMDAVAILDSAAGTGAEEEIASARPSAPSITPEAGEYNEYISVTVSSEEALCLCTFDGVYPSIEMETYTGDYELPLGSTVILALALDDTGLVSGLTENDYLLESIIEPVVFADSGVELLVRSALGTPEGEPVTTDQLWKLSSLSVLDENGEPLCKLSSLEDLRLMTSLGSLDLTGQVGLDYSPLSGLSKLKELNLSGCGLSSRELTSIAGLDSLEYLNLSESPVTSISVLSGLKSLKTLDANGCSLSTLEGIDALKSLEYLDISDNALTDLSLLASAASLETLICKNLVVSDISALASLTRLEHLDIEYCGVSDLAPLGSCTKLKTLMAASNQLAALDALSGCPELVRLDISRNTVADLSPLAALKKLEYLDASNNALTVLPADMSALASLSELYLSHNAIKDLIPTASLSALVSLDLEYNSEIATLAPLLSCKALKSVKAFGTNIENDSGLEEQGVTVYK